MDKKITGEYITPTPEGLKSELWTELESVIPDSNHEYNDQLKLIKSKYEFISYDDMLEELGRVEKTGRYKNEIKGLDHTKDVSPNECVFMKATREDNEVVYAVIGVGAMIKYRADFFSPHLYNNHGGNHDFNRSELLDNLYSCLTRPSSKVNS